MNNMLKDTVLPNSDIGLDFSKSYLPANVSSEIVLNYIPDGIYSSLFLCKYNYSVIVTSNGYSFSCPKCCTLSPDGSCTSYHGRICFYLFSLISHRNIQLSLF